MNMINYAIRHLAKKTYSECELREILEAHFGGALNLDIAIEETIGYLKRYSLVDDERLAHHIASSYIHKGNRFIKNTLSQRKIKSKEINAALMKLPDEYTRAWVEAKQRLAHPISRNTKNEQVNTIARFLAGRQFNHLVINKILDKLCTKVFYPTYKMEKAEYTFKS
jgi:SOS response regulatory protein OraA/RecX